MAQFRKDWFMYIDTMQQQMERFLQHFSSSKPPAAQFLPCVWEPAINVYEAEQSVIVLIELAGVSQDDVEVLVDGNNFIVRGERQEVRPDPQGTYHRLEICCGPFQREIPLPVTVDADRSEAVYRDGFLEITLPKTTHSIHVQVKS